MARLRTLNRELRVALQDLHFQAWFLVPPPNGSTEFDSIIQRATVCAVTAFEWTRYANEFRLKRISGTPNQGISMACHINKGGMR